MRAGSSPCVVWKGKLFLLRSLRIRCLGVRNYDHKPKEIPPLLSGAFLRSATGCGNSRTAILILGNDALELVAESPRKAKR